MRAGVECSGSDSVMPAGLARAQARDRREALATLRELELRRNGRALFASEEALVWLALGERGRALDDLERAQADGSGWLAYLDVDPRLDPLRKEPRFGALRSAGAELLQPTRAAKIRRSAGVSRTRSSARRAWPRA